MLVESLAIPDVKLITPKRFADSRGYFEQTYQRQQYHDAGIVADFVQDNHSRSVRGVLRGLHYQHRHPQAKLVSVSLGSVYDVAVDLRQSSPTFGRAVGAELSAENGRQLFVPRGFAHGFLVLSDTVDFCYKCDDYYAPGDEYGVLWSDPALSIDWPPLAEEFVLSEKDAAAPLLNDVPASLLFE